MSLASGAENTQVEGFGASHSRRVTPGEFATPKLIYPGPPHAARDAGGILDEVEVSGASPHSA